MVVFKLYHIASNDYNNNLEMYLFKLKNIPNDFKV